MSHCKARTEVYSRIVGYFRPVQQWNIGKQHEYHARAEFRIDPEVAFATPPAPTVTSHAAECAQ